MIFIVACCHGVKLCAHAARDFRLQQYIHIACTEWLQHSQSADTAMTQQPIIVLFGDFDEQATIKVCNNYEQELLKVGLS